MSTSSKRSFTSLEEENDIKTVWDYFVKSDSNESAKCQLCSAMLKISQRSKKGLFTHLKSKHNVDLKSDSKVEEIKITNPKKKSKTMNDFVIKENSMEKTVSRLVSIDGFSFNVFSKSSDLRGLFLKIGLKLPDSSNTIKSIVLKFAESIKNNMISEIDKLREQNQKFSVTFDEWTSLKNKRYINVNIHRKEKFYNLGLVRIIGSCTAEYCIKLVEERLSSFHLNIEDDVICITTDGASLMVKIGKLVPCYQQLCFAHGIQLAIVDVLYKKKSNVQEEEEEDPSQIEEPLELELSNEEDELGIEDEDSNINVSPLLTEVELISDYTDLVSKVRKAVKVFRKSPTKNDLFLQKYVQEECGKNLEFNLDCKTRWSSLFNMLERFYKLRLCVSKALIDAKSDIYFTDEDWLKIKDLISCLEPVKLGVEVLCRGDSTLISAETTLRFIVEKLKQQTSILSADLTTALCAWIKQRRTQLTGILSYLQNPRKFETNSKNTIDDTFVMPKKLAIRKEIKNLLRRVTPNKKNNLNTSDESTILEEMQDREQSTISLQDELEFKLQENCKKAEDSQFADASEEKNMDTILKKEMSALETNGSKGKYLSIVYDYLMTIPPTSVEAERAFSAAGLICNKLRSSLADNTINTLCFLRSYFKNEN